MESAKDKKKKKKWKIYDKHSSGKIVINVTNRSIYIFNKNTYVLKIKFINQFETDPERLDCLK